MLGPSEGFDRIIPYVDDPEAYETRYRPSATEIPLLETTVHFEVSSAVPGKSSKNRNVASPSLSEGAVSFP